jgi:hypothetical protein
VLTLADVLARVKAQPAETHHVWRAGWPSWKAATDVEEIAAALHRDGPPPPP